jgi:hypothetical protein
MSETPTPKPISDLSQRVVSLAREIDRLPPGAFTIQLTKPEMPGLSWHVEIVRLETIREMELPRREVSLSA